MSDEILYHYTTVPGFHGIIQTKELWASKIHFMNDHSEFSHGIELCKKRIQIKFKTDFKDRLLESLDRIATINIFVSSFSKHKDLLSQWRGYCSPYGIALGFSKQALESIGKEQPFKLAECIYDESEKIAGIDQLLDNVAKAEGATNESDEANEFLARFCRLNATFKHEAFKEEGEYRLVSRPLNHTSSKCHFRIASSVLIPSYKIDLVQKASTDSQKIDLGLKKILIGPNPYQSMAVDSAIAFMANQKVRWEKAVLSQIPYRRIE